MHNLSGVRWDDIFAGALDWQEDISVGMSSGYVTRQGTTEDILPYNGTVTLSFDDVTPTSADEIAVDNNMYGLCNTTILPNQITPWAAS